MSQPIDMDEVELHFNTLRVVPYILYTPQAEKDQIVEDAIRGLKEHYAAEQRHLLQQIEAELPEKMIDDDAQRLREGTFLRGDDMHRIGFNEALDLVHTIIKKYREGL